MGKRKESEGASEPRTFDSLNLITLANECGKRLKSERSKLARVASGAEDLLRQIEDEVNNSQQAEVAVRAECRMSEDEEVEVSTEGGSSPVRSAEADDSIRRVGLRSLIPGGPCENPCCQVVEAPQWRRAGNKLACNRCAMYYKRNAHFPDTTYIANHPTRCSPAEHHAVQELKAPKQRHSSPIPQLAMPVPGSAQLAAAQPAKVKAASRRASPPAAPPAVLQHQPVLLPSLLAASNGGNSMYVPSAAAPRPAVLDQIALAVKEAFRAARAQGLQRPPVHVAVPLHLQQSASYIRLTAAPGV